MIKKNQKIAIALALALITGVSFSYRKINMSASSAGWVQASNGSWTYNKEDGSKTTGWMKDKVDWYYFWSDGSMATNSWVQSGGNWYYLTANGTMATDTVINGWYVNSDGVCTTRPSGDIYTGAKIKDKVRSLGFLDKRGQLALNPNGVGNDQDDYLHFNVLSGNYASDGYEMNLTIFYTNAEVEHKVPIILNWILPTKGDYLNTILQDPNLKSQVLELDGRKIEIESQQRFLGVTFGPIK